MNFANHVDAAARRVPGKLAVADGRSERTFADLSADSDAVAGALEAADVEVGDRVAIHLPNSVAFVVTYLGVMKRGAVPLPVNTRFTGQQIRYVLRDSDAVAVVTSDRTREAVEVGDRRDLSYRELLEAGDSGYEVTPRLDEAAAELLYTSGTTGAPKGVVHTHGNLDANARGFVHYKEWTPADVALTVCQCFHVTGLNVTTTPFLRLGAENHLLESWDAEAVLAAIERHGVTYTFLIPTMLVDVLEHDAIDEYDLSSLETVGVGGSPMPRERIAEVEATLGCTLLEGYGMTETTPLAAFNRPTPAGRRAGSVGRPAAEVVDVRVEDPETGEVVPSGERGELLWRGDTVAPRYTSRQLTDDRYVERQGQRWLKSGDVGWLDDEGFLFVVDRLEDMFTTGCGDIYPREIEAVIYGIDPVQKVAIVDTKDHVRGATVTAVVKCRREESVSADAIRQVCERNLESHEVPDRIEFVESFPRTATGKIDRVTLRDRFA